MSGKGMMQALTLVRYVHTCRASTEFMRRLFAVTAIATCVSLSALSAKAQQTRPGYDLDLEIGAAAGFQPSYEGARTLSATGFPIFVLHFIRLPVLGELGGGPDQGWSFSPSFRVVGQRKQTDDIRLFGLGNIDAAFEFGGKATYRWQNIRVFAEARKGLGGHYGWTGSLGADYIARPASLWTVEFGPRLDFASSSYMAKYFGINSAQSIASGYGIYSASAGLKGIGVATTIRRQLNENWAIISKARYTRLVGDAGNSPIVRAGSQNGFSASLGLSYRFRTSFSRN